MGSARRLAELEADGIVAEVIYPGGGGLTIAPFDAGLMTYQYEQDPAIWAAGCRAYNRWLADFCNETPGRHAGVALVTVDDIDATVREVESLRDRGIFGGILLPSSGDANPLYNHSRYEPLWRRARHTRCRCTRTPGGHRTTATSPAHSASSSPRSPGSRIARSGCWPGRAR